MKNLWKYSGWYLVGIGVIHSIVGLMFGSNITSQIIRDGLINTVNLQYDRNFLFWFLATGLFWIFMGFHWQHLFRVYKRPLPAWLGLGILLFSVAGVAISPASGIWLFFPLVFMILQPHFNKTRDEEVTG